MDFVRGTLIMSLYVLFVKGNEPKHQVDTSQRVIGC